MRELPEPGAQVVARAAVVPLLKEPRISSQQVSQRVSGHVLDVLERGGARAETGEWLLVSGDDEYRGWVHRGFVEALDAFSPEREDIVVSLGCTVEFDDGARRHLPLGARLWPDEMVVGGASVAERALPEGFPRERERVVESASELFAGTPYQWGGITPWGADCSGFVQSIYALHGMRLPRDAWQQAGAGEDAGTEPDELVAGDLLFFSDRDDAKITHVGIALGALGMLHSALGRGGWALDVVGGDEPYQQLLRQRFRFGRRFGGWRDEG